MFLEKVILAIHFFLLYKKMLQFVFLKMKPKVSIEVKGELQLSVYNNQLDIACNVSELKEYEKPPYTPNTNQ